MLELAVSNYPGAVRLSVPGLFLCHLYPIGTRSIPHRHPIFTPTFHRVSTIYPQVFHRTSRRRSGAARFAIARGAPRRHPDKGRPGTRQRTKRTRTSTEAKGHHPTPHTEGSGRGDSPRRARPLRAEAPEGTGGQTDAGAAPPPRAAGKPTEPEGGAHAGRAGTFFLIRARCHSYDPRVPRRRRLPFAAVSRGRMRFQCGTTGKVPSFVRVPVTGVCVVVS